jgi:hypothetical protein
MTTQKTENRVETNLDKLLRLREEALAAGFGSGRWIRAAQALMDAFPGYYATARAMNEERLVLIDKIESLERLERLERLSQRQLQDLLERCLDVISTISGEDTTEDEMLDDLERDIKRAIGIMQPDDGGLF